MPTDTTQGYYGMPVLPYESIYIGVPWVFDILNFTSGEFKTAADGPVTPELAASRDLLHWDRPVRDALIEPGKAGARDDGAVYTASNIIVDKNTISMYYAGFNTGHGGADSSDPNRDNQHGQTGLATWRRDGFLSLTNASQPGLGDAGEVITKPVVFSGKDLHLNATVHPKGTLTVQVLDADGNAIPGFTSRSVRGDQLVAKVLFGRGDGLDHRRVTRSRRNECHCPPSPDPFLVSSSDGRHGPRPVLVQGESSRVRPGNPGHRAARSSCSRPHPVSCCGRRGGRPDPDVRRRFHAVCPARLGSRSDVRTGRRLRPVADGAVRSP